MDVFKWEPKQKNCSRTQKHFLFLSLVSEKKKKRDLRARLAPILLKEVDLLPRLSSEKFFQILQSLLFYFVKSRDAIPWTLLVYADVENKKLSFVRCQLWKLGRKLLLGDFRNPWCICSSAQVILQDRGCIPLSWPYLTLLPLPSPSWQGSATFVPHVTDVLAAQKLAVNREKCRQQFAMRCEGYGGGEDKTRTFQMLHLLNKWSPVTHNATGRAELQGFWRLRANSWDQVC